MRMQRARRKVGPMLIAVWLLACGSAPAGAAEGVDLTVAAASSSANGRPEVVCPEGFNLGALTLEERLQLPKVQAGLDAGIYTVEDIIAVTEFLDRNANGLLCVQDITERLEKAAEASGWAYHANVVDDNAAAHP